MRPFRQHSINCLWLIVLALVGQTHAQQPFIQKQASCPGGVITTMDQDNFGIILAGTRRGLYQFDGMGWEKIQLDTLDWGEVSVVKKDPSSVFWIGTGSGRLFYREEGEWKEEIPGDYVIESAITGLEFDGDSSMWISTYGAGIFLKQGDKITNLRGEQGIPDDQVYQIALDPKGRLWAATDAGLVCCFWNENNLLTKTYTNKDGLPDIITFAVSASPDGTIYTAGFEGGVSAYNADNERFTPLIPNWELGSVRAIVAQGDGRIYAGTESHGVCRIFNNHLSSFEPSERVTALLIDQEQNLWAAARGGDLYRAFTPIEILDIVKTRAQAIAASDNDLLWIGGTEGLYSFNPANNQFAKISFPFDMHIISLLKVGDTLWIGTFGEGLFLWNMQTKALVKIHTENGLPDNNVLSINLDKQGIWLATLGGVALVDRKTTMITSFKEVEGLPQSYIYQVLPDRRGGAWVATDGKGLFFLNKTKAIKSEELGDKTIYSVYQASNNDIWAATEDGELYKQGVEQFTKMETGSAAPFTGIEGDQNGNVFAIGKTACNWYQPSGGLALSFSEYHGLGPLERNLNASTIDQQGRIWVAAGEQILCVWPLKKKQRLAPSIQLKRVNILLESIGERDPLKLAYNENHLSFEYLSSWFQAPEAVTYRHRLVGYNMDWVQSLNTEAIYPKLTPGNYSFEVQAGVNGDFRHSETDSFNFKIHLPWWREPWFISAALISLGLLVWFILDVREKRLKKIAELEQEKITFQLETLRQQINPHFLFNSLNTLLDMVEEGHQKEAVIYIERLSDLFRNVLTHRHQTLISLSEEIALAKDFYQLQKHRFGAKLKISIDVPDTDYFVPPLTTQLLVENAIKHNEASRSMPLMIELFIENEEKLIVRNNLQERRTPASSTGTGLHNIKSRYKVLTSEVVEIIKDDSFFTVKVPLLKEHDAAL